MVLFSSRKKGIVPESRKGNVQREGITRDGKRKQALARRPKRLEHGQGRSHALAGDAPEQVGDHLRAIGIGHGDLVLQKAPAAVQTVPAADGVERIEVRIVVDERVGLARRTWRW